MRRTVLPQSIDGLREFLHGMRRDVDDLQRVRNPPPSYVEAISSSETVVEGSSTILDGAATQVVAHGLDNTPKSVVVSARSVATLGVPARTSTTFTVARTGTTGDLEFDWIAAGQEPVSAGTYEEAVLALSPLLFWPLDDASGTTAVAQAGANGAYAGGLILRAAGPTAKIPYAITTDGTNDNVTLADWPSFPKAGDISVSLWAKWSTSTLTKVALALRTGSAGSEEIMIIANRSAAGRVSLYRAGADRATSAAATYNDNAWHHIVGVVNQAANTTQLYIDGALVGSGASAAPSAGDRTLLVASNRLTDTTQFFPGSTAMVAVFDYPLTSSHVTTLYSEAS